MRKLENCLEKTILMAIDPGATGAIALFDARDGTVKVHKMPDTPKDILSLIARYSVLTKKGYIENVGQYMPGDSATAATTFAKHVGHLEMALIACRIPFDKVAPRTWQKIIRSKPKRPDVRNCKDPKRKKRKLAAYKRKFKNHIKSQMQELYPRIKVTLATADALAILTYVITKEHGLSLKDLRG